jgi:crotonobetainyl-CoA:carnitine CoA-transferase CaiB-like acyl-CoA transferase
MVARGFFETVPHPVAGAHPVQGLPWRSRGVDHWIRRPAPTLGQHNHEVLGGRLGLSPDDIATLEAMGVARIFTPGAPVHEVVQWVLDHTPPA